MSLDEDLRRLVIERWTLVYDLHQRAEEVREQVRTGTQRRFGELVAQRELPADTTIESTSTYWYVVMSAEGKRVAYVQAEMPAGGPRPEARVFTAVYYATPMKVSMRTLKDAVLPRFVGQFESTDGSGQRGRVVSQTLPLEGDDVEGLIAKVVDEVWRQLEVCEALRTELVGRLQTLAGVSG